MPKSIEEINAFNKGIILNADEKDIPNDSAAMSFNIDPNTEDGILDAIKTERLISSVDGKSSRVIYPLTWGQIGYTKNDVAAPILDSETLCVEDISAFEDCISSVSFIGARGYVEKLSFGYHHPHMERLIYASTHTGVSTTNIYGVIEHESTVSKVATQISIPDGDGDNTTAGLIHSLNVDDYIQFNTTTSFKNNDQAEIMKIIDVDLDNTKITVERGMFGSIRESFATSTNYNVFINKITYNAEGNQVSTNSGYFENISGWSQIKGNHLRGPATPYLKTTGLSHTASDSNSIVFNNSAKTMVVNNGSLKLRSGDRFTFYATTHSQSSNHTSSFKIITIKDDTYYLDTAPVTETITTSAVFYFEPTLIKNFSFAHATGSAVGNTSIEKVNDWKQYRRAIVLGSYNKYLEDDEAGVITQKTSGGLFSDTNVFGSDLSTSYYPYLSGEYGLEIGSKFQTNNGVIELGASISATDTILTLPSLGAAVLTTTFTKGDTIYIGSEYMRVLKVATEGLHVERGIYNTIPASHSSGDDINFNNGYEIRQEIDKDWLKPNTEYELSFWARIGTGTAATGRITAASATIGDYEDKTFTLVSASGTSKTYRFDADNSEGATGTVDAADDSAVIIQLNGFSGTSAEIKTLIRDEIEEAIEDANGHNGEITVADNSTDAIDITQAYHGFAGNTDIETTTDTSQLTITSFSGGQSPDPIFSVMVNGGYMNNAGEWNRFNRGDVDNESGFTQYYYQGTMGQRFNLFSDCSEVRGIPSEETINIDGVRYRNLSFRFKTPRGSIKDNMVVTFGNRGILDKTYYLSNIALFEESIAFNSNVSAGVNKSSGFIKNKESRDLVMYDSNNNDIKIIPGFNNETELEVLTDVDKSRNVTMDAISSRENAVFNPRNREVHIGFGGDKSDSNPKWLGYINHKVFGVKYNNLYLDTDKVDTYDDTGINNLSKICVAGEWECLGATISSTGSIGDSNTILTVSHTGHGFTNGDNLVVREYLDTNNSWAGNGIWYVSDASATNSVVLKRNTDLDDYPAGNASIGGDNDYKISYRPFYYYGIKRGSNYIYRITPETRVTGASSLDTVYTKGTIERTSELDFNIESICCSYGKNGNTADGGHIYALSSAGDKIYRININIAFDAWAATRPEVQETIDIRYKSFKWSNDHTNGNIGGTTAVYDSLADESSPTINISGKPSDIIETKGPKATFNWADSDNNEATDVNPDDMDTRLWIQAYPDGDTGTFTDGDRFLFCGKTEYATGGNVVYFADRTPPTVARYGMKARYTTGGAKFVAGPFHRENPQDLAGSNNDELPANYIGARALYGFERQEGEPWGKHKIAQWWHNSEFDFTTGKPVKGESYNWNCNHSDKPYVEWGHNVGWDGNGSKKTAIKVARYGLFQIADNDGDGLLDGTGVVVPNTSNYVSNKKSYGDLHRRVSSHAVGLIGSSELNWIRHAGKVHGIGGHYFSSGDSPIFDGSNSGGFNANASLRHADVPNYMDASKIVFVCTDMHFGELPNSNKHEISSVASDANFGAGATYYTKVTTATNHGLQAGDLVYFNGTGDWPGWSKDYHVVSVISDVIFYVAARSNSLGSNNSGEVLIKGRTKEGSDTFHFAFNTDDKTNGEIFNQHGGFGRLWYTEKTNFGPQTTTLTYTYDYSYWDSDAGESVTVERTGSTTTYGQYPAISNFVDQLNWQAGFMIRPFNMDDSGFEKLLISEGLSVDMPCFPDAIYHAGNHVKSGTDVGNQVASKLFLSSPGEVDILGEVSDSKMFICEWNFLYPNESSYIPAESVNTDETSDTINGSNAWEINFAGTIDSYLATAGTSNEWEYDATLHPVVEIDIDDTTYPSNAWLSTYDAFYKNKNIFAGLYLTIVDQTTGYTQTRKIIGSMKAGDGATANIWLSVHYPFAHTPVAGDKYYIWKHSLVATAPVRLVREETLRFAKSTTDNDEMVAYVQDPILGGNMYKQSGTISDLDGSGSLATVTTSDFHNLTTNDKVIIEGTTTYNGTYAATVTGPKQFTFSHTGSTSNETGTWSLPQNSTASTANPISLPLRSPAIKMNFGDLDMRKLKSYTTSGTDFDGDAGGSTNSQIRVTATANKLSAGDVVTADGARAQHDGTYVITSVDTDNFDIENPDTTDDGTESTIYTNQWGGLAASSTGDSLVGEIRAGLSQWDKGNADGNVLRYDASDNTRFIAVTESSVSIKAASVAGTTDFFRKNTEYSYKISLIYDGYQEGPLSMSSWGFTDTASSREALDIQITVKEFSKRLSDVCLYRKDTTEGFYRLVKQIQVNTGWAKNADGAYIYNYQDKGTVRASYEARTGINETTRDLSVNYGLAAELDSFLFVGDCSHTLIDDASNQIFRSKPGMFSIFDWSRDYIILNSKPTALVSFNGRLIAFDENNMYKINPQTLAVEDIFEGVGCSGKDSVIVTEYGMFFANRQGAYMYTGGMPTKISSAIQKSGSTDMLTLSASSVSGTSEIKDLSWDNTAGNKDNESPYVAFDSQNNIVMFFVDYFLTEKRVTSTGATVAENSLETNTKNSYIWAFSLEKQRWDLWELAKDEKIGKPFSGKDGEVYVSAGNGIYQIQGGADKKFYTWLSKKMTVGRSTQKKVFNKVKVTGPKNNLIQDGVNATETDKLVVATDVGRVTSGSNSTTANITYKSDGNESSDYKLKGSNKTGKWVQFKLEEMEEPVSAVGLIFRLRSVK